LDTLSTFKAAAVQAAPCFLDRTASVAKACRLIEEAADNGASLIVFPEVFIPGYPYWNWCMSPLDGSKWFKKLCLSAVDIPSAEIDTIANAARRAKAHVVMGINERHPDSKATIYNTNLIFSPEGEIIGKHRKLVPTFAEKLTWASGDGSSIRVYDTELGRIGTLACGENTNTLARFALLAQGEQIHIANFIGFPFTQDYDMPGAIQTRAGAHSFEGKLFTIVACSAMSDEIVDKLATDDAMRALLTGTPAAYSGIYGPNGRLVSEALIDEEGIVYGDIDLNACIEPKQYQDIIGHYNRFDIFQLNVNRTPQSAVTFRSAAEHLARTADPAPVAGPEAGAEPKVDRSVSSWGAKNG